MQSLKHHKSLIIILAATVVSFLLSLFFNYAHRFTRPSTQMSPTQIEEVERILHQKEAELNDVLNKVMSRFESIDGNVLISDRQKRNQKKDFFFSDEILQLESRGLAILIYENDSLKFWSKNTFPASQRYSESYLGDRVIETENAVYVVQIRNLGRQKYIGLIHVRNNYPYQNRFLRNEFQEDFNLPASVEVSLISSPHHIEIHDTEGNYLFSLRNIFNSISQKPFFTPSIIFFVLYIIFFLTFQHRALRVVFSGASGKNWILGVLILLIAHKVLASIYRLPSNVYALDLFSPTLFAQSDYVPSLGDLLIVVGLVFILAYNLFVYLDNATLSNLLARFQQNREKYRMGQALMLMIAVMLIFFAFQSIINLADRLIIDSTISFDLNQFSSINAYTFLGLAVIILLFAAFIIVVDKVVSLCVRIVSYRPLILSQALLGTSLLLIRQLNLLNLDYSSIIFLIILFGLISYIRFKKLHYSYYTYVFIVLLVSLHTVIIITRSLESDPKEERSYVVNKVKNVRDFLTEYFITELEDNITHDPEIAEKLTERIGRETSVKDIIQKQHFKDLKDIFTLDVTICDALDSLDFAQNGQKRHCYSYYDSLLFANEDQVENTSFCYFDNEDGSYTYLGWIPIVSNLDSSETSLFIQLNSRKDIEILGYPEILIDERFEKSEDINYSFAKYKNGRLVFQSGDYSYRMNLDVFGQMDSGSYFIDIEGYNHYITHIDPENTIVVSKPTRLSLNSLISFSYVFFIFYLLTNIVLLINRLNLSARRLILDLRQKIQLSMIAVISLTLILIGGGTIVYITRQQSTKYNEITRQKLQSVILELRHVIRDADEPLSIQKDKGQYISDLLKKIAYVNDNDIHMYDVNGNLIGTSQPEIFARELVGTKMNPIAFRKLNTEAYTEFMHNEHIGGLKYLSAYAPFVDDSRQEVLAYVNLPYFSKEMELRKDLSALIIAFVNAYALLILLAITIAIFLADRIVLPLKLVQSKFSEIELGKPNEQILYTKDDEVGSLIRSYNRMVAELARSAELLAKSEREGAWREMAKQIAHEIKNPLTPMKLSVQLLQRSWFDNDPEFAKRLARVTTTLIEQIDRLSSIATGFSSFAKLPQANNTRIDLRMIIANTLKLFENDTSINYNSNIQSFTHPIYVYADEGQLSRVFINLIKNATQAMREGIEGKINVQIEVVSNQAVTRVIDNGTGIPEEVRGKLFRPNFTTKSSGMGLGLAIVKNIIENANGRVWFDTELQRGTTFYVMLPLYTEA